VIEYDLNRKLICFISNLQNKATVINLSWAVLDFTSVKRNFLAEEIIFLWIDLNFISAEIDSCCRQRFFLQTAINLTCTETVLTSTETISSEVFERI
jgi:hypothetical protein